MPKLIVDLNRFRNVIYGCVRHIDQHLKGSGCLAVCKEDKYSIYSEACPELTNMGQKLYVLGTSEWQDDRAFSYNYDSVESAEEAYEVFLKLIEEINNA